MQCFRAFSNLVILRGQSLEGRTAAPFDRLLREGFAKLPLSSRKPQGGYPGSTEHRFLGTVCAIGVPWFPALASLCRDDGGFAKPSLIAPGGAPSRRRRRSRACRFSDPGKSVRPGWVAHRPAHGGPA